MLDTDTKRRIDSVHDILVGKVLDPQTFSRLDALPFGMTEANHFGRIRSELSRIGRL